MLPTVLMNALKEYTFVGSPLWRMLDGKDLVRVELTFHKVLPTKSYKKRAESKRQPALSAGECLRQPAPGRRPTTTPTNALYGAGGVSTIAANTTRHRKRLHHIRPHPEDSYHRAITSHQEACHTTFYSRQPAKEEIKTELSA